MASENNNEKKVKEQPLNILHLLVLVMAKKKSILLFTSIVMVVSIVMYFFVFDLIFFSAASIKGSGKSNELLSTLTSGMSDIGGLGDLGLEMGNSARELAEYKEILISRRCIEPLIVKFNLMEKEEYRFMEDAIKDFRDNKLVLNEEKLAGVLYVGVYDKDPVQSKEMVEFLLSELDKINISMKIQSAKNNKEFIERRYFLAKEDLARAEDSLKSFQLIYGIAPDLQIKATVQSVFTLEAESKAEEVKLDVLKKILSADQPEVKTQEAKVNSLKNKIAEIQTSTELSDILRLGNSPDIAMSFLRLQREIEIQTKILTFVLPLYEKAKIEEKKETPTIMVLDNPYVAERKTKPKRLTMVIALTIVGFFASIIYFIMKERFLLYKKQYMDYKLTSGKIDQ